MNPRFRLILSIPLLGLAGCSGPTGASDDALADLISAAQQANTRLDVETEERDLRKAVRLPGSDRDRVEARRALAHHRAKFHHDFEEAAALLAEAAAINADSVKVWAERADMERRRGDTAAAADAARRAIAAATSTAAASTGAADPFEQRMATMALSAAIADHAVTRRLAGSPTDESALIEALDLQRALVRSQPGDLDAATLMLTLAVLLDRPEDAREAWRAYYYVTPDHPGPGLIVEPGRRLEALYEHWRGDDTTLETRAALADALADSRFHLEAALVALDPAIPERDALLERPRIREIVAYSRFCRRVREDTDAFYRLTSLGKGRPSDHRKSLVAAAAELWPALDRPRSTPPTDRSSFNARVRNELSHRFGTFGYLGNGHLYLGHAVIRDTRTVEQYGHRGVVTYTVVDHMVSNGQHTWAWSDTREVGGWATANTMVSVRSGLLREAVNIWNLYSSPVERATIEKTIERESAADDERARKHVAIYLPGLYFRMALQSIGRLVNDLEATGLRDQALRLAFINKVRAIGDASAIFAHEGRHAIDLTLDASQKSPDLEFTAKLSEIAFSPEPRISMISIMGPSLGDDTPHGRANLKFARGAVAWMKAHEAEIEGFDPSRPHLPQLDLLTDVQIVAVARSMDPLVD